MIYDSNNNVSNLTYGAICITTVILSIVLLYDNDKHTINKITGGNKLPMYENKIKLSNSIDRMF